MDVIDIAVITIVYVFNGLSVLIVGGFCFMLLWFLMDCLVGLIFEPYQVSYKNKIAKLILGVLTLVISYLIGSIVEF